MEYMDKIRSNINNYEGSEVGKEAYSRALEEFVKGLPEEETAMKDALDKKDYNEFKRRLVYVCEMLDGIKANDLAEEARAKFLEFKENKDHSYIEAYINYFLATASMLSIDIQMEMHKEKIRGSSGGGGDGGDGVKSSSSVKNILAVDDTTFFLSTLKSYMQDMPQYKLTCVTSGDEALRFIKKVEPDLFILDIEMPNMNGFELAEKLNEMGQKAPFVFLTANSAEKTVLRAIELGAADFIVKPTNRTQVISKISKFL